jgi:hypothetical protein
MSGVRRPAGELVLAFGGVPVVRPTTPGVVAYGGEGSRRPRRRRWQPRPARPLEERDGRTWLVRRLPG